MLRGMRATASALVAAAMVCAAAGIGRAQTELRAPGLPAQVEGEYAGPESVLWNPALLADARTWHLAYLHRETAGDGAIGAGTRGGALFFGTPVLGPLSFGAGVAVGRPADSFDLDGDASDRMWGMISLAGALRLGPAFSLGALYRGYLADQDADIDGFSTMDLGVAFRPCRFASVSAAVADLLLPRARPPGYSAVSAFERRYLADLSVRPLGDDFLTVGASFRAGETSGRMWLGGGVAIRPLEGLTVRGRFDARVDGCPDADCFGEWQVGTAVEVAFAHFALGGGIGVSEGWAPVDGFDAVVRLSGAERPALARRDRIVGLRLTRSAGAIDRIETAAWFEAVRRDPDVAGVLLVLDGFDGPVAAAQEIRREVGALRGAGMTVWCAFDEASGAAVYVCSAADRVLAAPGGGARLTGVRARLVFMRRLLDRLGIRAEIVRIGEYKSMPETFTETEPSAENVEALGAYLDDAYASLLGDLASGRGLDSPAAASERIDRGPFTAQETVDAGLADEVAFADEVVDGFEREMGASVEWLDLDEPPDARARDGWRRAPAVAVLRIEGTIVDGKSRRIPLVDFKTAGDRTLVEAIDRLRRDRSVAAVVLAIDSGGGSAVASDNIWRAVMRLRARKPVVASMGTVAASGAYYVAAAATELFALPATLTGSIGIFYGKADVGDMLRALGVNSFEEGRGERATMESWSRPYTGDEIAVIEGKIAHYYGVFLDRIAEGRPGRLARDEIDAVGQGRIWSGRRAAELGLVDAVGGLGDAVARARVLADLPDDAPVLDADPPPRGIVETVARALAISGAPDAAAEDTDALGALIRAARLDGVMGALLPFLTLDPALPMALLPYAVEPGSI